MLKLLIDNRELSLINQIKDRELEKYKNLIEIEIKQLDVGDVHIISENNTYIFERKTVKDLIASVKDGRYKEQKYRLLASGDDISYIIEGDDITSSRNFNNYDLLSSIYIYSLYRDNIKLIFTRNIVDTCTFVLTMCCKIIDHPDKFIKQAKKESYVDCIKMKKSGNITPEICYIMQLSQIPSISTTIAKNIAEVYPSMNDLLNALKQSDNKIETLTKINKIGKDKANKILEYLII